MRAKTFRSSTFTSRVTWVEVASVTVTSKISVVSVSTGGGWKFGVAVSAPIRVTVGPAV
jgi:hypothetical protein